jgi:hypothetical protein
MLLAYVYGVVPVSLCRSGVCGISTSASGVRLDFDEDEADPEGGNGGGGGGLAGGDDGEDASGGSPSKKKLRSGAGKAKVEDDDEEEEDEEVRAFDCGWGDGNYFNVSRVVPLVTWWLILTLATHKFHSLSS